MRDFYSGQLFCKRVKICYYTSLYGQITTISSHCASEANYCSNPFEIFNLLDPISLRLQELHDALDDDCVTFADLINPGDFNLSDLGQDLPPPPPELLTRYV